MTPSGKGVFGFCDLSYILLEVGATHGAFDTPVSSCECGSFSFTSIGVGYFVEMLMILWILHIVFSLGEGFSTELSLWGNVTFFVWDPFLFYRVRFLCCCLQYSIVCLKGGNRGYLWLHSPIILLWSLVRLQLPLIGSFSYSSVVEGRDGVDERCLGSSMAPFHIVYLSRCLLRAHWWQLSVGWFRLMSRRTGGWGW